MFEALRNQVDDGLTIYVSPDGEMCESEISNRSLGHWISQVVPGAGDYRTWREVVEGIKRGLKEGHALFVEQALDGSYFVR